MPDFEKGNTAAEGRKPPKVMTVKECRKIFFTCLTTKGMRAASKSLIEEAGAGKLAALQLFFSITVGKHEDIDMAERMDEAEKLAQTKVELQVLENAVAGKIG